MANVRFKVSESLGIGTIIDRAEDRVYAFGGRCRFMQWTGSHRAFYTVEDAQAVCDMLNQREAIALS